MIPVGKLGAEVLILPGKVLMPSTRKSLTHSYLGGGLGRVGPFQITRGARRIRLEGLLHK